MRSRLPTIALLASLVLGFGPAGTAGAAAPAGAAGAGYTAAAASGASSSSLVEQAQYRDRREWRRDRREWRRDRREWRRDRREWRDHRRHWHDHGPRARFYFHIEPRRYYRPRPVYRLTNAHYRWCERRYRSYRAWDNTYQPYHGPRRQCHSPYS